MTGGHTSRMADSPATAQGTAALFRNGTIWQNTLPTIKDEPTSAAQHTYRILHVPCLLLVIWQQLGGSPPSWPRLQTLSIDDFYSKSVPCLSVALLAVRSLAAIMSERKEKLIIKYLIFQVSNTLAQIILSRLKFFPSEILLPN